MQYTRNRIIKGVSHTLERTVNWFSLKTGEFFSKYGNKRIEETEEREENDLRHWKRNTFSDQDPRKEPWPQPWLWRALCKNEKILLLGTAVPGCLLMVLPRPQATIAHSQRLERTQRLNTLTALSEKLSSTPSIHTEALSDLQLQS